MDVVNFKYLNEINHYMTIETNGRVSLLILPEQNSVYSRSFFNFIKTKPTINYILFLFDVYPDGFFIREKVIKHKPINFLVYLKSHGIKQKFPLTYELLVELKNKDVMTATEKLLFNVTGLDDFLNRGEI